MADKIVQTAGRDALGAFAPEFAHFNDDVLFGENWNNPDIDVKTRCIITVVALMASYQECERSWCITKGNGSNRHPCGFLCWLAKSMGSIQFSERSIWRIIGYLFIWAIRYYMLV